MIVMILHIFVVFVIYCSSARVQLSVLLIRLLETKMACGIVCKHCIQSLARSVKCCVCGNLSHVHCLSDVLDTPTFESHNDWICLFCSDNIFPFNHFSDDDTFSSNINDFFGNVNIPEYENVNFNPFDTNGLNESTPLVDVDPDLQFFNNAANFQDYTGNCRYFIEDTF